MPVEIERKFLVESLPRGHSSSTTRILQGYFPLRTKGMQVRLRKKESQCFITIKAGKGRTRVEEEVRISTDCFTRLWPLVRAATVRKTRYKIPYQRHNIEIDVYQGEHRGLKIAEVEFQSQQDADSFNVPVWLGPEVTGDSRFENENLARRSGVPSTHIWLSHSKGRNRSRKR